MYELVRVQVNDNQEQVVSAREVRDTETIHPLVQSPSRKNGVN